MHCHTCHFEFKKLGRCVCMYFFIYLSLVCLPFVFADTCYERNFYKLGEKRKNIFSNFCYICACVIVLTVSILRHPFTGTDSINNYYAFIDIIQDSPYINYEFGYVWLVKFLATISENYMFFLKSCTGIILIPIMCIINRMPYRSLILLCFILGELNATYDVIKGFLSFALIVIGFYCLYYKKKKIGIVWMLLSLLFHITSIFFLGLFWVASIIKNRKIYCIIAAITILFVATPLFNITINSIVSILTLASERFSKYHGILGNDIDFSPTYILTYLAPVILGMLYFKEQTIIRRNEGANKIQKISIEDLLVNINCILLILTVVSTWIPVLHRFLKLSLLFNYMLVALCLHKEKSRRNRIMIILVVILANVIFSIVNNQGFTFTFFV